MIPDRLPTLSLALLLAACPNDKGTTQGGTTTDTTGSATDTSTAATPTSSDTAVTEAVTTQDTADCEPIPCDGCPDGCTAQSVCNGSQASCECDCEGVSTSEGESTSAPGTATDASTGTSGGTTAGTTDTSGTTSTTGTTTGTSTDTTTGEPAIACDGEEPFFPEFDRVCVEESDCALVFHQIDCCGSLVALGISADAAMLFAEAEAECVMQYPQCDCPSQPTVADDGNSTANIDLIAVTCLTGKCFSFLP